METRLAEKFSPYFKFFNEMSLFMHSATLFSSIHCRNPMLITKQLPLAWKWVWTAASLETVIVKKVAQSLVLQQKAQILIPHNS